LPVTRIYVAGGTGGSDYGATLTCPANYVAVGLHGKEGVVAGNFAIDTLGVSCRDMTTGALSQTDTVGVDAGTTPFTLSCPDARQMIGVSGRQGTFLDQITIRCR
jgi:hypothetical protein